MATCECATDGGDACYQQALAEAGEDVDRVRLVEFVNRSRRASGVPYHVVDPATLAKVTALLCAKP